MLYDYISNYFSHTLGNEEPHKKEALNRYFNDLGDNRRDPTEAKQALKAYYSDEFIDKLEGMLDAAYQWEQQITEKIHGDFRNR